MSVTPEELLTAADKLFVEGDAEVDWRNAVSRAYYAAYHRCRSVAAAQLLPPLAGSVHAALYLALVNAKDPLLKSLGYMLNQCRLRRGEADYEVDATFDRTDAESVLETCHRIMAKADLL